MRATAPTVWMRLVAFLVRGATRLGVSDRDLLADVGLDRRALDDADARVPLPVLHSTLERIVERTRDELAPLALVRDVDPASLDALGFLALTSPTLGAALEATMRYQRVFTEGDRYELVRGAEVTTVRYLPWGQPRAAHTLWADLFARDLGVNLPALVGSGSRGVRVRLRRRAPRDRARFDALLGVEAELDAPSDVVELRNDLLSTPIPRADPMLAAFFARHLEERLAKLPPESLVARVAHEIDAMLPDGGAELDAVAARMALAPRTLQRRLASERTSFSTLVDDVRRGKALALLDSGVAIAEIAWLLGYSEPSALHRAFVRWTGTTPISWRSGRRR